MIGCNMILKGENNDLYAYLKKEKEKIKKENIHINLQCAYMARGKKKLPSFIVSS